MTFGPKGMETYLGTICNKINLNSQLGSLFDKAPLVLYLN